MGKRSRHKAGRNWTEPEVRFLTPEDGNSVGNFNQLARPNCSDCGGNIDWLTGDEATARGIDLTPALQFIGITAVPDRDVWACPACGNWGLMGS